MAELTTEDQVPSYSQKKFIEYSVGPDAFNGIRNGGITLGDVNKAGAIIGANGSQRELASRLSSQGLGGMTVDQFKNALKDINFVQQYGLGKTFSYEDLALEALSVDPTFDPNNSQAVSSFAQDLERRGLTNNNREDIRTLATNYSIKDQIDRAQNPGKYLGDEQKASNLSTAQRLTQQTYGDSADPDLAQFLAERLAEGESAFELSQFLQTTPQYLKKQSDAENARVQQESAAARSALDEELLRGEEEAFRRAQPAIISSYMKAGRLDSSGLQSALAKARADLQRERQGFLANAAYNDSIRSQGYQREDFVGANAQAFNQYLRQNEPAYQQRFAVNNASNYANFQAPYDQLNRYYSLQDQNRQRQWQLEDYNMQKNDYLQALSSDRRAARRNLPYQLLGSLGSAGLQGWAMGGFK